VAGCFTLGVSVATGVVLWVQQQRVDALHEQVSMSEQRVRLRDDQIIFLNSQRAHSSDCTRGSVPPSEADRPLSKPAASSSAALQLTPRSAATVAGDQSVSSLTRSNPCYEVWEMERKGMRPIVPCVFALRSGKRDYVVGSAADGSAIAAADTAVSGTKARAARPGEVISIFCAGLGPVSTSADARRHTHALSVRVGGQPAEVAFAGIVGPLAVSQLLIRLPLQLPDGDLSFEVEVAGVPAQRDLVLPVRKAK
jgi:hypothetical protein